MEDSTQVKNTQENTEQIEETAELENADSCISENPKERFMQLTKKKRTNRPTKGQKAKECHTKHKYATDDK